MAKTIADKLANTRALTAGELIELLKEFPPDAIPGFTCDYGDYTHTIQFLPITEVRGPDDDEYLAETAYSKSGIRLDQLDEDDLDGADPADDPRVANTPKIVILM